MSGSMEKKDKNSLGQMIRQKVQENLFWVAIKAESGIDLPLYLKHLLHCNGFDSAAALKNFKPEDITGIEFFAKQRLPTLLAGDEESLSSEDFYYIYYNDRANFIIPPGHKACILEVSEFIKSKGIHFFQKNYQGPTNIQNQTTTTHQDLDDELNSYWQDSVLEEEKKLHKKLSEWYERQPNGSIIFKTFIESPSNQFIQVYKTEKSDGNISFSAKVQCVLCDKSITAHKELYGRKNNDRSKTRWIFQNFLNHIKNKHMQKNDAAQNLEINISSLFEENQLQVGTKRRFQDVDSSADLSHVKREKVDGGSNSSSDYE